MSASQLGLSLDDGYAIDPKAKEGWRGKAGRGELAADDPLPPGPYTVGLTHDQQLGDTPPWTVRCGDGRAIAGHVPSRAIAEAIADALNRRRAS